MSREAEASIDENDNTHFYNHDIVHNQVARQTHIGNAYHAPINIFKYVSRRTEPIVNTETGKKSNASCDSAPPASVLSKFDWTQKDRRIHEQRQKCLEALKFSHMDSRQTSIRNAYAETCQWLLQRREYTEWKDDTKLAQHHGLLWVKGKPGTGKSTIVKFAFASEPLANKIAFFFNARGDALDKSTKGMYRSLLVQIFQKLPGLQPILDSAWSIFDEDGPTMWTLAILKNMFREVVQQLKDQKLVCFIDALDECNEGQVRDMVGFFEEIGDSAINSNICFRTCFSSRHYPHITIALGISLVLEDQEGHNQDLETYLATQLRIGNSKLATGIRREILQRASGIFLWIVLVTQILNKEHDHGRIFALRRRMDEIPNDLEALFNDILTREGSPNPEVIMCLQCVLYAHRPLRAEELYFAILAATETDEIEAWDSTEITEEDIARFVISTSKGLVEVTKPARNVQFIHESVRDFLTGRGLENHYFAPADTFSARSHDLLKRCCQTYYEKARITTLPPARTNAGQQALYAFPFLGYAVENVLYHSNAAQRLGLSQQDFLGKFSLGTQVRLSNLISDETGTFQHSTKVTILYILAEEDLPDLIELKLRDTSPIEISFQQQFFSPLYVTIGLKNTRAFQVLFNAQILIRSQEPNNFNPKPTKTVIDEAMKVLMGPKRPMSIARPRALLAWATAQGEVAVLTCLLYIRDVDMDEEPDAFLTLLKVAASENRVESLNVLLQAETAIARISGFHYGVPLKEASLRGYTTIVVRLLEAKLHIHGSDIHLRPALEAASAQGHVNVVSTLLKAGIKGNQWWILGPALCVAAERGHLKVVETLLEAGTNTHARPSILSRALMMAAANEYGEVAKVLLQSGAEISKEASRFCATLNFAPLQ